MGTRVTDRNRIPTPEEFGREREEDKKPGFLKRLFSSEPLKVDPEVGEQKQVLKPSHPFSDASHEGSSTRTDKAEVSPGSIGGAFGKPRKISMPASIVRQRGEEIDGEPDGPPAALVNVPAPIAPPTGFPEPTEELEPSTQDVPVPQPPSMLAEADDEEPGEAATADELADLQAEIHRLRTLLVTHGVDPDGDPTVARPASESPAPIATEPQQGFRGSMLGIPTIAIPSDVTSEQSPGESLFFLTNRFSPMKVAVRVLANLRAEGQWPQLREFQLLAAQEARRVGLKLKRADQVSGVTGARKRSTGFPIGPQEAASLSAYVDRFTLSVTSGPLAILGLAAVVEGKAVLTEAGWNWAAQSNPLIDGTSGATLGATEIELLRQQLLCTSAELTLVREFLEFAQVGRGIQTILDEFLFDSHPDWDDVASWRSAMTGRLREIEVIEIEGRGPRARIQLLPGADALVG